MCNVLWEKRDLLFVAAWQIIVLPILIPKRQTEQFLIEPLGNISNNCHVNLKGSMGISISKMGHFQENSFFVVHLNH